jgi:hypothetical protein
VSAARFQVEGFYGAVIMKEFTHSLDGQMYAVFVGTVSIIEDKKMLGFDVSDRETNWVARVDGPHHSYNFAGCQVKGVVAMDGPPDRPGTNTFIVP